MLLCTYIQIVLLWLQLIVFHSLFLQFLAQYFPPTQRLHCFRFQSQSIYDEAIGSSAPSLFGIHGVVLTCSIGFCMVQKNDYRFGKIAGHQRVCNEIGATLKRLKGRFGDIFVWSFGFRTNIHCIPVWKTTHSFGSLYQSLSIPLSFGFFHDSFIPLDLLTI